METSITQIKHDMKMQCIVLKSRIEDFGLSACFFIVAFEFSVLLAIIFCILQTNLLIAPIFSIFVNAYLWNTKRKQKIVLMEKLEICKVSMRVIETVEDMESVRRPLEIFFVCDN